MQPGRTSGVDADLLRAHRGKNENRQDLLPRELRRFTRGDHGGSHPHLAHEFIRSIVERRPSAIHAQIAADWTAAGICANESALREGEPVTIPAFT